MQYGCARAVLVLLGVPVHRDHAQSVIPYQQLVPNTQYAPNFPSGNPNSLQTPQPPQIPDPEPAPIIGSTQNSGIPLQPYALNSDNNAPMADKLPHPAQLVSQPIILPHCHYIRVPELEDTLGAWVQVQRVAA